MTLQSRRLRRCPRVDPSDLVVADGLDLSRWDYGLAGQSHGWGDDAPGERTDPIEGSKIEAAGHQMDTQLVQNDARALSFNGLGNAAVLAAIRGGRHVAPAFAGDTVYCWSEVLEKAELPGRTNLGALRVRSAAKDTPCDAYPDAGTTVLQEPDAWVLMPRRGQPA